MNLSPDGGVTPAPRRSGNLDAIAPAYNSGMRFDGDIDIPVIDWRHYLEHQLDMHHSHQSFATRRRLAARARRRGQPGDLVHRCAARRVALRPDARGVRGDRRVDGEHARASRGSAWRATSRRARSTAASTRTAARSRPATTSGTASSTTTPPGACTQVFPIYSSSRSVAGGPIEGGIFKCGLQTVDAAISAGEYGDLGAERRRARRG